MKLVPGMKCYMCDAPAVTKEDAPPRSFYPKDRRTKLITVPSCDVHNAGNHLDVEAVRNVVPLGTDTNEVGLNLVQGAVLESFRRNRKLAEKTLTNLEPIKLGDVETGIFTCDLARMKHIMKSIAYAMHYHFFGTRYTQQWEVFVPGLVSRNAIQDGKPDGWSGVREALAKPPYTELPTPYPEVFRCANYQSPDGILFIFRLTFYGGNVVYVFTDPKNGHPSPNLVAKA